MRIELRDMKPEYEIIVHPEDMLIRGNYIISGDEAYDKQQEDLALKELEWNEWAWCCVEVRISFNHWSESAYLGGCSYKDEDEFITHSGYYEQMKEDALEELAATITRDLNESIEIMRIIEE